MALNAALCLSAARLKGSFLPSFSINSNPLHRYFDQAGIAQKCYRYRSVIRDRPHRSDFSPKVTNNATLHKISHKSLKINALPVLSRHFPRPVAMPEIPHSLPNPNV
jgi:hypothetical protein